MEVSLVSDDYYLDMAELMKFGTSLGKAGREALPLARVAVQKSCANIKRDAQSFAPVDTGTLRNSIGYETKQLADSVEGVVGPTVEYGAYVEFGTSEMAPSAYLGPAFDRHAHEFEQAITAIVRRASL